MCTMRLMKLSGALEASNTLYRTLQIRKAIAIFDEADIEDGSRHEDNEASADELRTGR